MSDNINNKVVFITGGSSGLGEATARRLALSGAKIVLAARREERLKKISKDIREAGGECIWVKLDVTDPQNFRDAIDQALEHFQKLDVIVNNAGCMAIAPLSQTRIKEWDRMIDVNIRGVLHGIAAALPVFQKQGSGHFINLSSVAGIKVFSPGGAVYSGTKYAVRAISEGLRQELANENVRVTCIEPGAIESELKYGSEDKESQDFVLDFYKNAIPADSVARAISFAIEQPPDVGINEVALRPTKQVL